MIVAEQLLSLVNLSIFANQEVPSVTTLVYYYSLWLEQVCMRAFLDLNTNDEIVLFRFKIFLSRNSVVNYVEMYFKVNSQLLHLHFTVANITRTKKATIDHQRFTERYLVF